MKFSRLDIRGQLKILAIIILSLVLLWIVKNADNNKKVDDQGIVEKGQNGGALLKSGDISLELLIFERAMPPHFRAYIYKDGKMLMPGKKQERLIVQLTRFNGKKDDISFIPIENFLQSNEVIPKPHSFDVGVQLEFQGKHYNWHYSTYEGRVKIVADILKAADIQIAIAQSQIINTQLKVVGKIVPNRDTLTPIYARYAGIIKSMSKNLGDKVIKGELLATIESNESLQDYNIVAPMMGTIVQKYASNGELAQNNKPIYEVANLTNVWADFTLYSKDAPLVKKGMEVVITGDDGKQNSVSTISYIAPLGVEDSQTILARAVLLNENRFWLPGMYVNGEIIIKKKTAPVAVLISALQKINDTDVVFVKLGDYFEATPVVLGERDNGWVEIISGIEAGQQYVSKNSFFIKAELGKDSIDDDD